MTVVVDSLGGVAVSLDPNPQSASFMTVGSAIKKGEGKEGGKSLGPLLESIGSEKEAGEEALRKKAAELGADTRRLERERRELVPI